MVKKLGHQNAIVAAAVREHHKLMQASQNAGLYEFCEALAELGIDLWAVYDPEDDSLKTPLYYQLGTLQYCHGRYEDAIESLENCLSSLSLDEQEQTDHSADVHYRLGMALAAFGDHEGAREVFNELEIESYVKDNWSATHETEFIQNLMELRELRGSKESSGPMSGRERQEEALLLNKMEASVKELTKYGEEHIMVLRCKVLLEEAKNSS